MYIQEHKHLQALQGFQKSKRKTGKTWTKERKDNTKSGSKNTAEKLKLNEENG